MKLISNTITKDLQVIEERIESGETLLFIRKDGKRYIVDREELNNTYATTLDCDDGAISNFRIDSEVLELFQDSECYTDIKVKIEISES